MIKFFQIKNKKSTKEAIFFYIFHSILIILSAISLTYILKTLTHAKIRVIGFITIMIANTIATIICVFMHFFILKEKNLLTSWHEVKLITLTLSLSILFGPLGGLIPVAYLTTFDVNKLK